MAGIVVMGVDGIGPEVVDAACAVLDRVAGRLGLDLVYDRHLLHGACWDVHGEWVLDETVEAARRADAVLVGAEGGPKWDSMGLSGPLQERSGLSRLRYDLDLYANLRPATKGRARLGQAFLDMKAMVVRSMSGTGRVVEASKSMTSMLGAMRRSCVPCSAKKVSVQNSTWPVPSDGQRSDVGGVGVSMPILRG